MKRYFQLLPALFSCTVCFSAYGTAITQTTGDIHVQFHLVDNDGEGQPLQDYEFETTDKFISQSTSNIEIGVVANEKTLTLFGSDQNLRMDAESPGADFLNGAALTPNDIWFSVGPAPFVRSGIIGFGTYQDFDYVPPGEAMDISLVTQQNIFYVAGENGIYKYDVNFEIIAANEDTANLRRCFTDTAGSRVLATDTETGIAFQYDSDLEVVHVYAEQGQRVVSAQFSINPVDGLAKAAVILGIGQIEVSPIGPIVVDIYDPATNALIASIPFPDDFTNTESVDPDMALEAGGHRAFVTVPSANIVVVVDLDTYEIANAFELDYTPTSIVAAADPAPTAMLDLQIEGMTVVLNASRSTSRFGEIAAYKWDFGDSTTAITTEPITEHEYEEVGEYTLTLTVVNTLGTSIIQTFNGHQLVNNGGSSAQTSQIIVIESNDVVAKFDVVHQDCGKLHFDASASSSTSGEILSYHWNFGNGQCKTCYAPKVSYVYPIPGTYTVTLTVKTSDSSAETSKTVEADGAVNPPKNLEGEQIFRHGKVVNVLTWDPPCKCPQPQEYRIYRDRRRTQYVATVKASDKLEYVDQVDDPGIYTYCIVAVDCACNQSEAACVTIQPL
jgi:PKD repeat protein